jgi:hypothetical protein
MSTRTMPPTRFAGISLLADARFADPRFRIPCFQKQGIFTYGPEFPRFSEREAIAFGAITPGFPVLSL